MCLVCIQFHDMILQFIMREEQYKDFYFLCVTKHSGISF